MLKATDLENILKRVHEWTWKVDTKVQILLALEGAALVAVFPGIRHVIAHATGLPEFLSLCGLLCTGAGVFKALQALFPRLHPRTPRDAVRRWVNRERIPSPSSITFFDHIAQMDLDEYRAGLNAIESDGPEYREEFIGQIHICSVIVKRKLNDFQVSAMAFGLGVVLMGVGYLLAGA